MKRFGLCVLLLALLAVPVSAGAAPSHSPREAWAKSAIALVTKQGIFQGDPASFRATDPLTRGALAGALAKLGSTGSRSADPGSPVSISQLDASVVDALGLRDAAYAFYRGASRAGLQPPARFGTEVVARLLGLRTDMPVADDAFELQPQQTATRADAAFTVARVLALGDDDNGYGDGGHSYGGHGYDRHHQMRNGTNQGFGATGVAPTTDLEAAGAGGGVQYVKSLAATFALPQLNRWQKETMKTAFSFIGYPYVWGGEDEKTEHGFDCSGFVWRVFKLQSYAGAPQLSNILQGRTAAAMAFEVPRSKRIHAAGLEPGDVMFFGNGPRSTYAQIDHAAIYLGNGWLIQSSGQGVALAQLGGNAGGFAWARRPLAEAGLEAAASTTAATATTAVATTTAG